MKKLKKLLPDVGIYELFDLEDPLMIKSELGSGGLALSPFEMKEFFPDEGAYKAFQNRLSKEFRESKRIALLDGKAHPAYTIQDILTHLCSQYPLRYDPEKKRMADTKYKRKKSSLVSNPTTHENGN